MSAIGGPGGGPFTRSLTEEEESAAAELFGAAADALAGLVGAGAPGAAGPAAAGTEGPPILIAGVALPRLGPPPTEASALQVQALGALRQSLVEVPPHFEQWRGAEWAERVGRMDPVLGPNGHPLGFGKLAIVRPGATNLAPGAAFLSRMAQHVDHPDGKVVIAYQGWHDPAKRTLREVKELDGVPIPPSLQGKLWAIGSEEPCVLAYDQASDQHLEALEALRAQADVLGFDPLTARATVVGFSEGALDTPLTRKRLVDAGFPDAIGRAVTIASGANGGLADDKWVSVDISGALTRLLGRLLGPRNPDWDRLHALLTEPELRARFTPDMRDLVDLSISARIGPPAPLFGLVGTPETHHNIRPGLRLTAALDQFAKVLDEPSFRTLGEALSGGSDDSDGLLTVAMGRFGRRTIVAQEPHDHAGMIEDPAIVDEILRNLD